jgi:hypothetical protein
VRTLPPTVEITPAAQRASAAGRELPVTLGEGSELSVAFRDSGEQRITFGAELCELVFELKISPSRTLHVNVPVRRSRTTGRSLSPYYFVRFADTVSTPRSAVTSTLYGSAPGRHSRSSTFFFHGFHDHRGFVQNASTNPR